MTKHKRVFNARYVSEKDQKEKPKETVEEYLKRGGTIKKLDYADDQIEEANHMRYYHSNSSILEDR